MQEQGYGINKGIPTLVMAAASFDNVLCISAFGVCLGIAFDSGELADTTIVYWWFKVGLYILGSPGNFLRNLSMNNPVINCYYPIDE